MHPALRKGPLFYKKNPCFPLFFLQNTLIFYIFTKAPSHFISCLRAWAGVKNRWVSRARIVQGVLEAEPVMHDCLVSYDHELWPIDLAFELRPS